MRERVIFFNEYNYEADMFMETIRRKNMVDRGILLKDTVGLPVEFTSIYDYYLKKNDDAKWNKKDIFYVFASVPKYWEIQADVQYGIVYDSGKIKAYIYFKQPEINRYVSHIDWLRDDGTVYKTDVYNDYGFVYCRKYYDTSGNLSSVSYCTSSSAEIICINHTNGSVTLTERGKVPYVFHSVSDFESYAMADIGKNKDIIYTSTNQLHTSIADNNEKGNTIAMALWNDIDISRCRAEGLHIKYNCPLYMYSKGGHTYETNEGNREYAVHYKKETYSPITGYNEALIYTWTDSINGLEQLVEAVPEVRFHIAAKTKVSNRLLDMSRYSNVTINQGVTRDEIKELYHKCDFYLDINEGQEVDDAIINAFMSSMLILGYKGCLHNSRYVLDENCFNNYDIDKFVARLKCLANNRSELEQSLHRQQINSSLDG